MFAQILDGMKLLSTGAGLAAGVLAFAGATIAAEQKPPSSIFSRPIPPQFIMTALLTREPSHMLTNRAFDDVSTLMEGGLPIIVNDQLIGAIGVGGGAGGAAYGEERCAHDGLHEVFGPQPAILPSPAGDRTNGGGIAQRAPAGGRAG
jgi:uncharacterized protein GlcG (DUF336 family)